MVERSSIAQVQQIGKEATPGLAVAATKRLGSLSFSASPNTETDPFRPAGVKFATVLTLNREWADVSYEGKPTYEEVIYPLASVLGTPVVEAVGAGDAHEWTFTPSSSNADVPATFTLESGQAGVQAEKFAHMLLTGFGLEVSRTEAGISGSGFAKAMQTAITMAAGLPIPTDLTPMQPGHFSVFLAEDPADFDEGETPERLGRVISVSPSVEDRYTAAWFVNQAEGSFTTFVENGEGVGGTTGIMVEADAAGLEWLTRLRQGDTVFLRVEAKGPAIDPAEPLLPFLFQWDQAVKVEGTDAFSDEDGIYAIGWTLRPVHDVTYGKAMEVRVRNNVAAI